jgi:hypothetical protein
LPHLRRRAVHRDDKIVLRIPNNTKVLNQSKNKALPASRLFSLVPGEQMHIKGKRKIGGFPVYLSCAMGPKGRVIIASDNNTGNTLEKYRIRWSIETLFLPQDLGV